jgi:hypothetical protein
MTYIEIWRDGHEAGMACVIKMVNDMCHTNFESTSDLITYMQNKESGLTKKDKENNQDLARRIAQQNWLWSDA